MNSRLDGVLSEIDAANSADPTLEDGQPAALLYGERMSAELLRLYPDATEALQIAARGQHIERWKLPRTAYPEGRSGYLAWRRDQARRHATRIGGIMATAGYGEDEIGRAQTMLRKEGIKRDAEVQMLEDVICFVFLRWYFSGFAEDRSDEQLLDIVGKTARKMSAAARLRALEEFDLPAAFAALFRSPEDTGAA